MAFEIDLMNNNAGNAAPLPPARTTKRPFERFTSDFFDFTGGLLESAGRGFELFGGRPAQQGPGIQAQQGIDTNTVLLVGAGVLVLALALRGK